MRTSIPFSCPAINWNKSHDVNLPLIYRMGHCRISGMKDVLISLLAMLFLSPAAALAVGPTDEAGEVPMTTCRFDPDWVRPSPEEMAVAVWQDNRYRDDREPTGVSAYTSKYYAANFVFFTQVSSGPAHLYNLTGLANTVPPAELGAYVCSVEFDPALRARDAVTVWSFGYQVTDAQRSTGVR